MFGQLMNSLGLIVAFLALSAEAKDEPGAKRMAIDAAGRQRPEMRSERQHPADVQRHAASGIEVHAAALGEMGNPLISEAGAEAIGERVAAAFEHHHAPAQKASVIQTKTKTNRSMASGTAEPTATVSGMVYLRQPAEHKGTYKTREWSCDACMLVSGKGAYGGDHQGCYTVDDFICAGGENCLMDGSTCYLGRVELPQGVQVTYFSGHTGAPNAGGWDNACVGRTDRGTTTDPSFPELKGTVPASPPVCAMKFELMSGYACDALPAEGWKYCGSKDHPPGSATKACSSLILAAAVLLALFRN